MKFQFESLSDFIAMGGHGGFVWVCYTITLVGLVGLIVQPIMAKSAFKKQQQQLARRQQAQKTQLAEGQPFAQGN